VTWVVGSEEGRSYPKGCFFEIDRCCVAASF